VDAPRLRVALVLLLGAAVLCGAAWSRGAEYDEQYTVFLLAGDARPVWPGSVFTADAVRDRFHGNASPLRIAADLRRHDVHPPLYFWAASAWSLAVGDTLFRLRLFSVLCGLAALATVGRIARRIGVPAALAMLVTLGCYAFAYTGSIARGFALAQLLALLGVWAALVPHQRHPRRRPGTHAFFAAYAGEVMDGRRSPMPSCLAAGLLLGAASFANYLAAFTAIPVLVWLAWRRLRDGVLAASGFAVFVAADLVFFLAQRDSRAGQFPPFHLGDGLLRLGKYAAAGVAGGLPLYAPASLAAPMTAATAIVLGLLAVAVAVRWRRIATPSGRALLAGCVIATPAGLLALGLIFDNTPIELRYLAFATPYAALLLAGALADRRWPTAAVLTLQAAAIAGLLLRPETMQPMRDAAREAAALADMQTVVLLPQGNDGVGLVGAFIASAPGNLRLMLAGRDTQAAALHGVAPRLAVALLDRDADSHATLTGLLAGFADDPCWRALPGGFNLIVFQSTCGDAPWVSSTASR
jgi:hypothetical protein